MLTKSKIAVGVVCESRMLRESLVGLLKRGQGLTVIDIARSMDNPTGVWRSSPDVVLIQHDAGWFSILRRLSKALPGAKLIIIDVDHSELDVVGCLQLGAVGFILRDAAADDLLSAIRAVAGGQRVVPDSVTAQLCLQLYDRGQKSNRNLSIALSELTEREQQVVRLLVEGLSNKEIAQKLGLSTNTVKCHVHNILDKLKVRSRIDLVNFFWRHEGAASGKGLPPAVSAAGA